MSNFSQSFGRLAWREQVSWGASRKSAPLELPVTPRVRVLETIDLSASGIEHFLRDDTLVPMTPKLTAFAPLQEIKALPPDSITA